MTVHVFLGAAILNHSLLGGTRLAVALFAIDLGATPLVVGLLMALFSLAPLGFALRIGRFIDQTGVKRPMLFSSLVLAGAATIPAILPTMSALAISSLLIGAGYVVYNVSWQHLIGNVGSPEERNRNFRLS